MKLFACWIALAGVTMMLSGCSNVLFFVANAPAAFSSATRTADLAYGAAPRQRLDVYAPRSANARPVVVFWYGGGWTKGGKAEYRFVGAALAARGIVAVLPDYRIYPAVKFPGFVEDGAQALAWVQAHIQEYGGDPERIVLMGHSAGAHIAAMLAVNRGLVGRAGVRPASIRGLIGLSGPYALDPNSAILHTIFAAPYAPSDWQPVRFVDRTSPPALLLHGLDDKTVHVSHTEKMRAALQAAGLSVETHLYPKRNHADTVAAFAWGARRRVPVLDESIRFIKSVTGAHTGQAHP